MSVESLAGAEPKGGGFHGVAVRVDSEVGVAPVFTENDAGIWM